MQTLTHPADPTEAYRRRRLVEINIGADRAELEHRHGQVWNLRELASEFIVVGFMSPYIVVRRKADGVVGSLEFQDCPRLYFGWQEDQ